MQIASFHASISGACGIATFSNHLSRSLQGRGHEVYEQNLRRRTVPKSSATTILHYVPSGFVSEMAWSSVDAIVRGLVSDGVLCVVVHGLPTYEIALASYSPVSLQRLQNLLKRADLLVALSGHVSAACRTWQTAKRLAAHVVEIRHPGLFAPLAEHPCERNYCFLGGVSRPKKEYGSARLSKLIAACESSGLPVWQHWTNVTWRCDGSASWHLSTGVLSDESWANAVLNSRDYG